MVRGVKMPGIGGDFSISSDFRELVIVRGVLILRSSVLLQFTGVGILLLLTIVVLPSTIFNFSRMIHCDPD